MHRQKSSQFAVALLAVLALVLGCSTSASVNNSVNASSEAPSELSSELDSTNNVEGEAAPVEPAIALDKNTTDTQNIRYFVDDNNLEIRGTDPVAYFTQGQPVAGRAEYSHTWNNATWQFATAENRDLFAANPTQYAPPVWWVLCLGGQPGIYSCNRPRRLAHCRWQAISQLQQRCAKTLGKRYPWKH